MGVVSDAVTDDRVTLPLTKTRAAAERLCGIVCNGDPWSGPVPPGGRHDTTCLMPLLAERDLAMAAPPPPGCQCDGCDG